MTINDWVKEIHDNAIDHGWWDEERQLPEIIALCHSELSEALEEDRADRPMVWHQCLRTGRPCEEMRCVDWDDYDCESQSLNGKPEGIAVEMLDCMIRIMDWFGSKNVNVERLLMEKHEYNKGRPYKHGKRY